MLFIIIYIICASLEVRGAGAVVPLSELRLLANLLLHNVYCLCASFCIMHLFMNTLCCIHKNFFQGSIKLTYLISSYLNRGAADKLFVEYFMQTKNIF